MSKLNSPTSLVPLITQKLSCIARSMSDLPRLPLAECAVSRPEIETIIWLAQFPQGVALKELAQAFSVTNGAASQVVESLVTKKIAQRQASPTDRRAVVITLTAEVAAELKPFRQKYLTNLDHFFADFSAAELRQLLTLLEKIPTSKEKECHVKMDQPG